MKQVDSTDMMEFLPRFLRLPPGTSFLARVSEAYSPVEIDFNVLEPVRSKDVVRRYVLQQTAMPYEEEQDGRLVVVVGRMTFTQVVTP